VGMPGVNAAVDDRYLHADESRWYHWQSFRDYRKVRR
jgi:hypothetical protein